MALGAGQWGDARRIHRDQVDAGTNRKLAIVTHRRTALALEIIRIVPHKLQMEHASRSHLEDRVRLARDVLREIPISLRTRANQIEILVENEDRSASRQ